MNLQETKDTLMKAEARLAAEHGEAGAQRAADHADRGSPSWSDRAVELLKEYAEANALAGTPFLGEDFRAWVAGRIQDPPDGRAFGAVFKRASRDGVIVAVGYGQANSSNGSPKTLWRRASA